MATGPNGVYQWLSPTKYDKRRQDRNFLARLEAEIDGAIAARKGDLVREEQDGAFVLIRLGMRKDEFNQYLYSQEELVKELRRRYEKAGWLSLDLDAERVGVLLKVAHPRLDEPEPRPGDAEPSTSYSDWG